MRCAIYFSWGLSFVTFVLLALASPAMAGPGQRSIWTHNVLPKTCDPAGTRWRRAWRNICLCTARLRRRATTTHPFPKTCGLFLRSFAPSVATIQTALTIILIPAVLRQAWRSVRRNARPPPMTASQYSLEKKGKEHLPLHRSLEKKG